MAGETRRVAEFISKTGFEDIPSGVVHHAKRFVLDHLGIAILGATSEPGKMVTETVKLWGGKEESTIIGDAGRYPSLLAPMANGTMAYSQMIDDLYPGRAHVHPGNCVLPAALALGESRHISGKDFINAAVVGYEVACRSADAVGRSHNELFFYEGSTNIHFGAAAASAKILGLDVDRVCSALGMVGSMTCGMWEDGVIQSTAQPLHAGKASSNGVLAALLANNGLAAGDTIFEGKRGKTGYLNVFSRSPEPEYLVDGLGTSYRLEGLSYKFHAAAGGIQPSIDATIALVEKNNIVAENVEKITVKGNRIETTNHNQPDPQNIFGGVQSSFYCVSRAITDGKVLASHMLPEKLNELRVRELMGKVNIELDPDHDKALVTPPFLVSATIVIQTKDGKVHEKTVLSAKGTASNPASDQDLEKKFFGLVSNVIPTSRAEAIRDMVWKLDQVRDISELAALLRP